VHALILDLRQDLADLVLQARLRLQHPRMAHRLVPRRVRPQLYGGSGC
jgi:hypothetical protein